MHIIHIICWAFLCMCVEVCFFFFFGSLSVFALYAVTLRSSLYIFNYLVPLEVDTSHPSFYQAPCVEGQHLAWGSSGLSAGFRACSKKHQDRTPEQMGRCSSVSSNGWGNPVGVPVPALRLCTARSAVPVVLTVPSSSFFP